MLSRGHVATRIIDRLVPLKLSEPTQEEQLIQDQPSESGTVRPRSAPAVDSQANGEFMENFSCQVITGEYYNRELITSLTFGHSD